MQESASRCEKDAFTEESIVKYLVPGRNTNAIVEPRAPRSRPVGSGGTPSVAHSHLPLPSGDVRRGRGTGRGSGTEGGISSSDTDYKPTAPISRGRLNRLKSESKLCPDDGDLEWDDEWQPPAGAVAARAVKRQGNAVSGMDGPAGKALSKQYDDGEGNFGLLALCPRAAASVARCPDPG